LVDVQTLKFDEWLAKRDALMAAGRFSEAVNLSADYTILSSYGTPLNTPLGSQGGPSATQTPSVAPDLAPAEKTDRQIEYDDLVTQAILLGASRDEAAKRARTALALRHGEEPDLRDMTVAELEAHAADLGVPDSWNPNRANRTQEDLEAEEAAEVAREQVIEQAIADAEAADAERTAWLTAHPGKDGSDYGMHKDQQRRSNVAWADRESAEFHALRERSPEVPEERLRGIAKVRTAENRRLAGDE
jgi:hypothetical protein